MAEPNHLFIEILPEATFRIGIGLKNEMITKLAFSVLVSEHALVVAKRGITAKAARAKISPFRRIKEDLNDDMLSMVEDAGDAFQERIRKEYEAFVDSAMHWIEKLPEFQKLPSFETARSLDPNITALKKVLRHFVRSRIMACLFIPLDASQKLSANQHRWTEQYVQEWTLDFDQAVYFTLSPAERILTVFFWQKLRGLNWSEFTPGLHDLRGLKAAPVNDLDSAEGKVTDDSSTIYPARDYAVARGVDMVNGSMLNTSVRNANAVIKQAVDNGTYIYVPPTAATSLTSGYAQSSGSTFTAAYGHRRGTSLPVRPKPKQENWNYKEIVDAFFKEHQGKVGSHGGKIHFSYDGTNDDKNTPQGSVQEEDEGVTLEDNGKTKVVFRGTHFSREASVTQPVLDYLNGTSYAQKGKGKEVEAEATTSAKPHNNVPAESIPLFNLELFLSQVKNHVDGVARKYLKRGAFDEHELNPAILLTDTILCLTDNEYAFLPLCVGGNEDGSGGVRGQPIPDADLGPSGPGPAFHTSHTSSSAASTKRWESSSVGTTIRVENGIPSHIDRRVVQSDDGILSERFSTDSDDYGLVPAQSLAPVPEEEEFGDDLIDMSTYDEEFVYESDKETESAASVEN